MGATNHMTGCRSTFSDLDRNIHGTVRFRDGSVVQIEGMGTILFNYKDGEHRASIGVYYIPRLNTNIISVGQLDEIGFQTMIEGGVMSIRDVGRSANHFYVLNVEIAAPCVSGNAKFRKCTAMAHTLWSSEFPDTMQPYSR
jgi:hypothetical protein